MYKKYPKIATNLSPGMSYLIVPTKESPETPIVIRLTPSKLNYDNYGPELKLINSYIEKVERFQKMTKTMTRKGILSKPLVLGSDPDFAKLISAMSNIYQHLVPNESGKLRALGKKLTLNEVTTEHPFYGELLKLMFDGGGVVPNTNKDGNDVFDTTLFETTYKPLFELAYEIDTAIHGERVSKRNHRGEVQAAFDKIARSNLVWFPTDSSNDMVILRDQRVGYKQSPGGKWTPVNQIGGRSLLGYASPEKTAGLFDGKVETRIKAKIKKRFATILKRELTNEEIEQIDGFELSKSLPTKDGSRRTQLTTDELKALMDMSTGESTANRDFGLRVPIQKSMVNNKKMPGIRTTVPGEEMNISLEEHFETNFDTVVPTRMSIFIANESEGRDGGFPPAAPTDPVTPEETTPEETTPEPTPEPSPTITEKSLFDILDPTTTIEDTSLDVDTMGTTSNPDPNPETILPEEPAAETVPDPAPALTVDEEIEKIERRRDYKLQHGIKNKNRLFGKLRDPSIKSPIEKLNIVYELLYFMETVGVYFTQDEAKEMDRVIAEMKKEGYRMVEEDIVNKRFTEEGAIEGRKGSIVVLKDRPDNTLEEDVTLIDVVIKPTIMKGDEMVQVPHVGIVRGSSKLGLKDIGKGTKKTTVLTEKEWIEKRKTEGTIVQKLNAEFDQQIKEVKERAAEKQSTEQPVNQPATQVTPTKVHPLDIEPKELSDPNRKKPKLKVGISGNKDGYKFLYGRGGKTTDFDGRTMLNKTYAEGSSAYGVSVNRGVVTYSKHVGIRDRGRGAPGILTVMIELPAGARMMPKDIIELLDEMMEDTVNRFTAGTFETTEDFSKDYSKIDDIASKFEDRTYFDNSLDKKIFNNNRTSNKPEESPAYAYHDSVDQLKEYLHDLTNPNYAKYARVYFTDSSTKGTKNDILETLNKVEGADLTKPQPSSQPVVSNKIAQPVSIHPLDKIPDELKNPNREKPKIEIGIAGAQGGFKGFYNNEAISKELFDTRGMGGTMPNTGATGYGISISEGAIVYSKSTAIQDTDRAGGSYGTVDVYIKMPAGGRMMPKDIILMLDELMEEALITHTDGRFRTGRGFGTNDHSFVERIHEKYKDKTYFDQSIDITQFDKWSAGKE
jgi:hypothetical protein